VGKCGTSATHTPGKRGGGSLHKQGGVHAGGDALAMSLPIDPEEDTSCCGDAMVEGGQKEVRMQVKDQAGCLRGPIDHRREGRDEPERPHRMGGGAALEPRLL